MLKPTIIQIAVVLLIFFNSQFVCADFTLDFSPDNTGFMSPESCANSCSNASPGYTPVLLDEAGTDNGDHMNIGETVYHPDTGQRFKHFIIGSLDDGFIQEVYIAATGILNESYTTQFKWDGIAAVSIHSMDGSGANPLGNNVGSATGNPYKVLIRQYLNDGITQQEFLKDQLDKKPKITQTINYVDLNFHSTFEIDMSHIGLNQIAASAKIVNIQDMEGTEFDFDMANMQSNPVYQDVQQNNYVNGGQYIYLSGAGAGGSDGNYIYLDGGAAVKEIDWASYYDHFETDNVWSRGHDNIPEMN